MNALLKASYKIFLIVLAILSIPLIAMQFTDEVVWSIGDFVVAGLLLFIVGMAVTSVRSNGDIGAGSKKLLVAFILLTFLLLWAELAVGIFFEE